VGAIKAIDDMGRARAERIGRLMELFVPSMSYFANPLRSRSGSDVLLLNPLSP
jgi:hypothetical protein